MKLKMTIDPKVVLGVLARARLVLTSGEYEVFSMFYAEGITASEISTMQGVSKGAVYKQLRRARKKMKVNWR